MEGKQTSFFGQRNRYRFRRSSKEAQEKIAKFADLAHQRAVERGIVPKDSKVSILCVRGSGAPLSREDRREVERGIEQILDDRELCSRCHRPTEKTEVECRTLNNELLCRNCQDDMSDVLF